jgi:general secretion pathway protein G
MKLAPLLVLLVCTTSCERWQEASRVTAPYTQLANFKTALDSFQSDCDRFPTTAEGLEPLIARPADIPTNKWNGPYLEVISKDPWGHDWVYRWPGRHNTNGFDLYSCGPDGVSQSGGDDADDISSWPKHGTNQ